MQKIRSIHFVGIKGVGMTPLAVIAKEAGMQVSGSDVAKEFITDEILTRAGLTVFSGFHESHVQNTDLIITTGAHGGFDNPQVRFAKEQHIPVLTQGEAVGFFMSGEPFGRADMQGISVAGCHGKTTTTAMIATILQHAGKDPSFVIGTGHVPSLGSSGHYGKGTYFVAEADEYATEPAYKKTPKFLWQHPKIAVVTNIEYDHPDLYPTFASLIAAYRQFMLQVVEEGGVVVVCGDDPEIQNIIKNTKMNVITYGFNSDNNYVLSDVSDVIGGVTFTVSFQGEVLGTFMIPAFGEHNALNGTASVIVGLQAGLSLKTIQDGLAAFRGTKRRLEFVGNTPEGAAVFDDYAHHPTEIKKTLATLRARYKDSNIFCVFQPHTFSRTKLLFDEFCDSFPSVDTVILTDIYASQRESFDATISSKHLAEKIEEKQQALYLPKLSDVVQYLQERTLDSHAIIITMGAGDVYQIAYEILAK